MGMLGGARSFLLPKKDSVDGMLPSHPILLAVVRRGNKCTCKIHELKYIMPGRRVLPCVCVLDNSGSILSWETEKSGRGG